MNKFFTLSLAAMAASAAMASVPVQSSSLASKTIQPRASKSAMVAAPAFSQYLRQNPMMAPAAMDAKVLPAAFDKRNLLTRKGEENGNNPYAAATAAGESFIYAYYNLGDGVFYPGLEFHEKDATYSSTGFYYTGNFMISQAHHFVAKQKLGSSWTLTNSEKTSLREFVNAEGDLDLSPEFGVGSFYGPAVASKKETYFYCGQWASAAEHPSYPNGFDNAGIVSGYVDEEYPLSAMAVYDTWENVTYVGFGSGQYAFGSNSVLTESGESHATLIDAGQTGGGLVIDHLQLRLISGSNEALGEGAEMYVTVADVDDEGNVIKMYTTVVTGDDLVEAGSSSSFGTFYAANVYFNEEDEDGFAAEVAPVINNNLQILIEDNAVNCDYGFFMNCDDRSDETEPRENSRGETYYMPVTAVRTYLLEPADGNFYGLDTYGANATVDIFGYHNYIGSSDGEHNVTGYVANDAEYYTGEDGVSYALAVSAVIEGQEYNDFDLESTFDADLWEIEFDEDVIYGFDLDDSYLEDYGVYALYVGVKAMPEGVTGRSSVITITSNSEASMTITINQGDVQGINSVVADSKKGAKSFNLMGQKTNAEAGLFVKDGKVVFVKK